MDNINNAGLTEILKEIKKLRQENIDLKNINAQLERKELHYAQKFMKGKSQNLDENTMLFKEEDKDVNDIISKYNQKNEELTLQLLSVNEKLNKFVIDKKNFDNYKSEAEVYKLQYTELQKKFEDLSDKFRRFILEKNEKLCPLIAERFTIYKSVVEIIQTENGDKGNMSPRGSLIQNFKNEILYEIKDLASKTNNNYLGYSRGYSKRSTTNDVNEVITPLTLKNRQSSIDELVKPFNSLSLQDKQSTTSKEKENYEFDPFYDMIISIEKISPLQTKLQFNEKYDKDTIDILKQASLISVSLISYIPHLSKSIINKLFNYANNSNVSHEPEFIEEASNMNNSIKINYSNLNIEEPFCVITQTSTQDINEYINNYIFSLSNVCILVIGFLTQTTIQILQEFEKKISNTNVNLVVVHYLSYLTKKNDCEYYLEQYLQNYIGNNRRNKLKKSYMFSLKEIGKTAQNVNSWYLSQENRQTTQTITHLFFGKDQSEAGIFFNNSTIEFITRFIKKHGKKDSINIVKSLKNYTIENKLKPNLKIEEEGFYQPNYSYELLKNNTILLIVIDVCDLVDHLTVDCSLNEDSKVYLFEISGERIMKYPLINNSINFSTREQGKFKINFSVKESLIKNLNINKKKILYEEGSLIIKIYNK